MAKICIDPGHAGGRIDPGHAGGRIDPGHAGGRIDPGAVNQATGLQEAGCTLDIALLVKRYLEAVGHETMLTRTLTEEAATDDLSYRTGLSNAWGADLFVSIHCNSAIVLSPPSNCIKLIVIMIAPGNLGLFCL